MFDKYIYIYTGEGITGLGGFTPSCSFQSSLSASLFCFGSHGVHEENHGCCA